MKQRFWSSYGNDFAEHELLEMLLYFALPRKNTNPLAHELINECGSLDDVINADPHKLERFDGVGRSTALLIAIVFAIKKKTDMQKYKRTRFTADSLTKVGNYFVDYFKGKRYEELCVMLLDSSMRLIGFRSLSTGSVNSTNIDIRELTKYALTNDAVYVIMAHNHPSGLLSPSSKDIDMTYAVDGALRTVGITLMEHIITSDAAYTPMLQTRPRRTTLEPGADPILIKNFYRD